MSRIVISFSVKEARDQLLNIGTVYTYRWRRRSFFKNEKGEVESTWASEGRGKPKIADVDIHEIGQFDIDDATDRYWKNSGFGSSTKWFMAAIEKMPPPIDPQDGWLFKVTVKSDTMRITP